MKLLNKTNVCLRHGDRGGDSNFRRSCGGIIGSQTAAWLIINYMVYTVLGQILSTTTNEIKYEAERSVYAQSI